MGRVHTHHIGRHCGITLKISQYAAKWTAKEMTSAAQKTELRHDCLCSLIRTPKRSPVLTEKKNHRQRPSLDTL